MTVTSSASCEAPVRGDEDLIRRLILNLLDNSLKYGSEGGTVDIRLARDAGGYRVNVSDTGPGIPPEVAAHVFERFYRGEGARARGRAPASPGQEEEEHAVGAGLGLAIARWVAEAHGGSLVLARSTPEGSEFVFTLPDLPES
jgi:signal transduction histidine kinase